MRIVMPYRAFVPESGQHRAMPTFDWIDAVRMASHTARLSNRCDVAVLTDETTALPVPALRYPSTQTRLTLWLLEIRLRYLESADFDRDTVLIDADELIYGDLSPWFRKAGLTVLVRLDPKHLEPDGWPLMNGVQWWRVRAKAELVAFYREALARAEQMTEDRLVWGCETDAVRSLLEPLAYGGQWRSGLTVEMVRVDEVMETFSSGHREAIEKGTLGWPAKPILDFRWKRKEFMRAAYEATILAGAAV